MALSDPGQRRLLHRREIEMVGYAREDGLYDIDARLTDTKGYAFSNHDRGEIPVGTPLHGMLARMTLDTDMLIHRFEASTEFGPFFACPSAAGNFSALAGLTVGRGFVKAANERVGGIKGCTHLREMLGQMATVAFQTLYIVRSHKVAAPNALENPTRPAMINSCLAYADGGDAARRTWPEYYAKRPAG